MQIRPVRSSMLPGEHTHEKEPALFLHTPLIHGLLSHSFTSGKKKRSSQTLAENPFMFTYFFI